MFRVPYYQPPWNSGTQIINLQQGGPSSHVQNLALQPRTYPTTYAIRTYGLGAMPRQIIGPTPVVTPNQYAGQNVMRNMVIGGIAKNPRGS